MSKYLHIEIIGYGYGECLLYYTIINNYTQIYQIFNNFTHIILGYPEIGKINDDIDEEDVAKMKNYIETLKSVNNIDQIEKIEMLDTDPGFKVKNVKIIKLGHNNLQICKLYCKEDL